MEKPTSIKIANVLLILELIVCIILTLLFIYGAFKSNLDAYKVGQASAKLIISLLLSILSLVFFKPLRYKRLEVVLILQVLICFNYLNIPGLILSLIPAIIVDFVPDAKRYLKSQVKA